MMEALLVEKDLWNVVDGPEARPHGSVNSRPVCASIKKQQPVHVKIIFNVENPNCLTLVMMIPRTSGKVSKRSTGHMVLPPD